MNYKAKYRGFIEEYLIITFEGIVVALIIATFALVGIYPLLFIPCISQGILLYLVVSYKKLKWESERAIEARSNELHPNEISYAEKMNEVKVKYFRDNNLVSKINSRIIYGLLLLSTSLVLVIYIPIKDEIEKKEKNYEANSHINYHIKCINENIETLERSLDSLKYEINRQKDSDDKMSTADTNHRRKNSLRRN